MHEPQYRLCVWYGSLRTAFERRNMDPATALAQFELLLKGEETDWCMRAKIDMKSVNGCLRDPVMYRFNADPHHITGTRCGMKQSSWRNVMV